MFDRNPARLEVRALNYESRGKLAKAMKCRQKAARLTGGQMGGIAPFGAAPLGVQQLGGQQFVGQQLGGQQLVGQPLVGQQLGGQQFVGQQLGGQQLGGQQFVGQQLGGQQLGGAPLGLHQWTNRTPDVYERNALKWERRGNFNKAQKNRGKVWRLQNPHYTQMAAPAFYNQDRFLGYDVPYTPTPLAQTEMHSVMPTTVEHIVRPTIVDETLRPERIVEVQPIVHREIEAPQVKIVEKHLYETVPSAGPSTITNAPIVQETVVPKIIEEIQPVVHREVPAPFVERVEQHVTEHIVKPTITTKEVINDGTSVAPLGFAAGGPAPLASNTNAAKPGLMGKVQGILHHNNANSTTTL